MQNSTSYFLSGSALSEGLTLVMGGEEARHLLKSRRIKPGERFALQDPDGGRFSAELISTEHRRATLRVIGPLPVPPLPARRTVLLQAMLKDKAVEWIVQKATELGVAQLVFFPAQNSALARKKPARAKSANSDNPSSSISRWERIAWEACKQSGRQFPPTIQFAESLDILLKDHGPLDHPGRAGWLLHPGEAPPDTGNGSATPLSILVGPEGGFVQAEVEAAGRAGFRGVGLGPNVLRAETAALTASALALVGGGSAAPRP